MLLGAEVLFGNILRLGAPGLFVAWLVTPVVIVFMYQFGVRYLRIGSRSLVMVIAAATSVCGVSAAIAVAAAARARKQELTLAVGMSLIFTVAMMILMPLGIRWAGMDPMVGAAWIGGTVDATGAVVAAGAILGEQAEQIAAVVKMIQNTLIGVVAFPGGGVLGDPRRGHRTNGSRTRWRSGTACRSSSSASSPPRSSSRSC